MKRGRHFVTVEIDAGDEEELAVLEASVASVTRSLHVAGLIAREDPGLAARHLFKMAEPVAGVPVAPAPAVEAYAPAAEPRAVEVLPSMPLPAPPPTAPPAPGVAEAKPVVSGGHHVESAGWACPKCGNHNYAMRVVCNMRKCGARRPGYPADGAEQGSAQGSAPPWEQVGKSGQGGSDEPAGSWRCVCGNLNFPHRTVCNGRNCNLPRPQCDGMGGGMSTMFGGAMNAMGGMGAYGMGMVPSMGCMGGVGAMTYMCGQGLAGAPPGSWLCPSCGNVNYPSRTTCNRRNCGLPRPS